MDNEQLFNILEKLIDELEFCATSDYEIFHLPQSLETLNYCKQVRQKVFTDKAELSFDVVSK